MFENRVQNGTQEEKSPAITLPLAINSDSEVNAKQIFNTVYKEAHKERNCQQSPHRSPQTQIAR